jgi:biopolymer transport protein ExbD
MKAHPDVSSPIRRRWAAVALLSLLTVAARAETVAIAVLTLDPGPRYALEGRPIQADELEPALRRIRGDNARPLVVSVRASRDANFDDLSFAIKTIEKVGASATMRQFEAQK